MKFESGQEEPDISSITHIGDIIAKTINISSSGTDEEFRALNDAMTRIKEALQSEFTTEQLNCSPHWHAFTSSGEKDGYAKNPPTIESKVAAAVSKYVKDYIEPLVESA